MEAMAVRGALPERARAMAPALLCVAALAGAAYPAPGAAAAATPLLPLVRSPAVYQLDARVVTRELALRKGSPATLNDLSDNDLDGFAEAGFGAAPPSCHLPTSSPAIFPHRARPRARAVGSACVNRARPRARAVGSACVYPPP